MARETNITFEQVASAADTLNGGGTKVTSRAIREVLGSGSMATICKYMAQWQSRQVKQTQTVDDTLDPAILRSINGYLASRVKEATAALTTSLADLQAEATTVIAENERQAADLDAQAVALQTAQDQCAAYSGRVVQFELDATKKDAELAAVRAAAESARVNLAYAEHRLEGMPRIEAEIAQVREDLAAERLRSAEQHELAAVANARYEAAQAAIEHLQAQLVEQRAEAKKSAEVAAELRGKLAAVEAGSSKAAKPVKKAGAV